MSNKFIYDQDKEITILKERVELKAYLSIAFARDAKTMRTIDSIYYSCEENCLTYLEYSDFKNSRLIIDAKYEQKERALRALAVLEAADCDYYVRTTLYDAIKKNFKQLYNKALKSEFLSNRFQVVLLDLLEKRKYSDTVAFSHLAVFIFFCIMLYGDLRFANAKERDFDILLIIMGQHKDSLKTYSQMIAEEIEESKFASKIVKDILNDSVTRAIMKQKNIASLMSAHSSMDLPKNINSYIEVMWRLSHFDHVPMLVYEEESFTRNELLGIINSISLAIKNEEITKDDVPILLLMGIVIRSFSRMHNKLIGKLTNNTTKNRLSYNENEKELKLKINSIKDKYDEQIRINRKKQQELNTIQIKYDKSQNTIDTLNSKIEELEEKTRVLEALLERKDVVTPKTEDIKENKKDDYISILNNKNIVVFGGPPNWHASVKKVLPNATCIPVSNKSFNTSIIDNSDIIVIKTDYLSHAQWYRIINQARNKNKKVLYCQNNIDMLLSDLAGSIKDD